MTEPETGTPAAEAAPPAATRRRGVGGETLRTVAGAMLFAMLLRSFGYEPFNIPSESMLPRLLVGDYLFVAKWPYGYSRHSFPLAPSLFHGRILAGGPERGDVAVFVTPTDNRTDFIKRVIGLPGDHVRMAHGVLFLNGRQVPKVRIEDYVVPVTANTDCAGGTGRPSFRALDAKGDLVCSYPQYRETLPNGRSYAVIDQMADAPGDNTREFVVPAGHYFMMGDNRDDSADSRFGTAQDGVGFVPAENLVGRASTMFFSTDGSASPWKPWTWMSATRWGRIGGSF